MTPVEPSRHLHSLLAGAGSQPRLAEEALRMVRAQPLAFLRELVALANQEGTGPVAASLLSTLLAEDPRLELAAEVYALVPPSPSVHLAPLAIQVTARLVAGLVRQGPADALVAGMLNNLSEWSADAGQHAVALRAAENGAAILRSLVRRDPSAREDFVILLNTLAKRLDAGGRAGEAVAVAREAVRQAALLPRRGDGPGPKRLAQSRLVLAHRLVHMRSASAALRPARQAVAGLVRLARRDGAVRHDLALGHLCCANLFGELGRHRDSLRHARSAHRLYWKLVAEDPALYLEYHLAAASTHAVSLGLLGRSRQAAAVAGRCVEYLLGLEKRDAGRFRRDLVAALTAYSNALAEARDHERALEAARMAMTTARKVRPAGGGREQGLEAQVATLMFHRAMEGRRFDAAERAARLAIEGFRAAADTRPEGVIKRALAWRNLAEVRRMKARSPRGLRQALVEADRGLEELREVPRPWPAATREGAAYCQVTRSLCLFDVGDTAAAAAAARAAIELRRTLPASPAHATDLAFALQHGARCELAGHSFVGALDLAEESAELYVAAARSGGARHRPRLAESLHLAAVAATCQGRVEDAARLARRAVAHLGRGPAARQGEEWEERRRELVAMIRAARGA